jgi:hypothetical protein
MVVGALPSHAPPVAPFKKPAALKGVPPAHMKNLSRPAKRNPPPTTARRTKIPRLVRSIVIPYTLPMLMVCGPISLGSQTFSLM